MNFVNKLIWTNQLNKKYNYAYNTMLKKVSLTKKTEITFLSKFPIKLSKR